MEVSCRFNFKHVKHVKDPTGLITHISKNQSFSSASSGFPNLGFFYRRVSPRILAISSGVFCFASQKSFFTRNLPLCPTHGDLHQAVAPQGVGRASSLPQPTQVLTITSMLSAGNVFFRPKAKQLEADACKAQFAHPDGDHLGRHWGRGGDTFCSDFDLSVGASSSSSVFFLLFSTFFCQPPIRSTQPLVSGFL